MGPTLHLSISDLVTEEARASFREAIQGEPAMLHDIVIGAEVNDQKFRQIIASAGCGTSDQNRNTVEHTKAAIEHYRRWVDAGRPVDG